MVSFIITWFVLVCLPSSILYLMLAPFMSIVEWWISIMMIGLAPYLIVTTNRKENK